ncbi:transposase DNA-binding-containing protein [Archangium violaceum]|uniref:IS4/Tn5 family transposase DNA-binding protein n=1 Tax=Archangium violaceum TaxID=83451 RepID=UPI0037BF97A0
MTEAVAQLWAQQEFGRARIGDARRTQRLVDVAAQVALRPAGKLTQVWEEGAQRQGAYRLVENEEVEARDMARAAHEAAFARAQGPVVYVPVDGTSLSLPAARDKPRSKGYGPVGTARAKARDWRHSTPLW